MEQRNHKIPLIVLLGPTASGKSSYAIDLAKEFKGEIVSADSRQVYRGLDIGSGKVTAEEQTFVPHHLLDVTDPGIRFTVADFKKLATTAILDIYKREKLPFFVGGSSLYIDVVVENYQIPDANQDINYRRVLERFTLDYLLSELLKIDPALYEIIDKKNKRRIIRALEVFHLTGMPLSDVKRKGESMYQSLILGVSADRRELYARIDERVDARMRTGMLKEVEDLLHAGVSLDWLRNLGLEYRAFAEFLSNSDRSERALEVCVQTLKYAIHDFARRQLIWFRKNKNIQWCSTVNEMRAHINRFLFE